MTRYAFLVTTWSGPKLVETIHHIPQGERLLVVDGSQAGWPLSKQWNYGISRLCRDEGYDAVIVCNDDIVLRGDTATHLAWALLEGQYAPDGGKTWTDKELMLISARHASPSDACTEEVDWTLLKAAEPRWQPGPDFSCFVTSRRLLDEVGPFDENFNPAYFEDNDMHRRIQLAGYEAGAFAPYWHFRSATTRHDAVRKAVATENFERNRQYYIQKHGGPPGQERYVTPFGR